MEAHGGGGGGNDTTTGASMYLSFDNSTLSTSAYKTLDAFTNSAMGIDKEKSSNAGEQNNSTLEAEPEHEKCVNPELSNLSNIHNDSIKLLLRKSFTNKMTSNMPAVSSSPLRPVSKLLNDYKAFSSTPSKNTNNVNGALKGNPTPSATLGLHFDSPHIDDKENEQPSETSVPTLSETTDMMMSSSVDTSKRRTPTLPTSTKKAKAELAKTISEAIASLQRAKSQALSTETPLKTGIPIAKNSNLKCSINDSQKKASNKSNKSKENLSTSLVHNKSRAYKKQVSMNPDPETIIENISPPTDQALSVLGEPKMLPTVPEIVVSDPKGDNIDSSPKKLKIDEMKTKYASPGHYLSKLVEEKLKLTDNSPVKKDQGIDITKKKRALPKIIEDHTDGAQAKPPESMAQSPKKQRRSIAGKNKRLSVAARPPLYSPVNKFTRKSLNPSRLIKPKPIAEASVKKSPLKKQEPTASNNLPNKTENVRRSIKPPIKNNFHGGLGLRRTITPLATVTKTTSDTSDMRRRGSIMPTQSAETLKPIPSSSATNVVETAKSSTSKSFTCIDCGMKFGIKSLMDAHRRGTHEPKVPDQASKKLSRPSIANNPGPFQSSQSKNQCRYCDKKFALERALHIHLLQNCQKIPAIDRRNLNYREMDHVEKAQTPLFSHGPPGGSVSLFASSSHNNNAAKMNSASTTMPSTVDGVVQLTDIQMSALLNGKDESVFPKPTARPGQSNSKASKTPAYNLYRTPTKPLPCPNCHIVFMNAYEYAEHISTVHSVPRESDKKETEANN